MDPTKRAMSVGRLFDYLVADPRMCASAEEEAKMRDFLAQYRTGFTKVQGDLNRLRQGWIEKMASVRGKKVLTESIQSAIRSFQRRRDEEDEAAEEEEEEAGSGAGEPPRKRRRSSSSSSSLASQMAEELLCPITHTLPLDPVTAEDGHLYERSAIEEWLVRHKATSPMTNMPMGPRLLPATHAKRAIRSLVTSGELAPSDPRAKEWTDLLAVKTDLDVAKLYADKTGMTSLDLVKISTIFPAMSAVERRSYVEDLHSVVESMYAVQVPCHVCPHCRRSKTKKGCKAMTPWRPEWLHHAEACTARGFDL